MLSHCHVSALTVYTIGKGLKMVKRDTSEQAGPFSEAFCQWQSSLATFKTGENFFKVFQAQFADALSIHWVQIKGWRGTYGSLIWDWLCSGLGTLTRTAWMLSSRYGPPEAGYDMLWPCLNALYVQSLFFIKEDVFSLGKEQYYLFFTSKYFACVYTYIHIYIMCIWVAPPVRYTVRL